MRVKEFIFEYKKDVTKQKFGDKLYDMFLKDPSRKTNYRHLNADYFFSLDKDVVINKLIAEFERADPTPNKQYVLWMISRYVQPSPLSDGPEIKLEDYVSTLRDYLIKFDKLKNKKIIPSPRNDIMRYNSVADFMSVIDEYPNLEKKKEMPKGESDTVYQDDDLRIIVPFDQDAACYYGQGTRWCTAATGQDTDNYFNDYSSRGKLYIIIPKKPTYTGEKYQFHFEDGQFMNEKDESITRSGITYARSSTPPTGTARDLITRYPQLAKIFLPNIKKTGNGMWMLSNQEKDNLRDDMINDLKNISVKVEKNYVIPLCGWNITSNSGEYEWRPWISEKDRDYIKNSPISNVDWSTVSQVIAVTDNHFFSEKIKDKISQKNELPKMLFAIFDEQSNWDGARFVDITPFASSKFDSSSGEGITEFAVLSIFLTGGGGRIDSKENFAQFTAIAEMLQYVNQINEKIESKQLNLAQAWNSIMREYVQPDFQVMWPKPEASRAPSDPSDDDLKETIVQISKKLNNRL